MPRKSHDLRFNQAVNLLESYDKAGYTGGERSFVNDMVVRMQSRRQMSTKQRKWLDSLIEQGVPAPKGNLELIGEIERLIRVTGTDHIRETLSDFLFREKKGWTLSPKQTAFRTRLIDEARVIERDGPWTPSNEMKERLQHCLAMVPSRSEMYWTTHAGEARAIRNVAVWLEDSEESWVDEWSVNKALHSFRVGLKELDNPYVSTGAMIWGNSGKFYGEMGIVTGLPFVDTHGVVSYPVLIDGVSLSLPKGKITKRRPKARSRV